MSIVRRLGKKPVRHDPRTLKLSKYIDHSALPDPPSVVDWTGGITNWGMMLNDQLGDCTCAAMGHAVQSWSVSHGKEITVPNSDILSAYEEVGGYRPGDPSTDNGAVMLDCLNYWRQRGIGGHKIFAFVSVNVADFREMRTAAWLFGGLYAGVGLPVTAQDQVGPDSIWTVTDMNDPNAGAGTWGGHAIYLPYIHRKQDNKHRITAVTWGGLQHMTGYFAKQYMDECYAVIGCDWVGLNGVCPSGFKLPELERDLAALAA